MLSRGRTIEIVIFGVAILVGVTTAYWIVKNAARPPAIETMPEAP
ncbi:MAG TPA: hypothetical protein VKN99_04165 [Polyangia bacterium]|nr:hypothetical protein [Polyangia bacterium]